MTRRDHKGLPVASVAFESWREGLEDCDYLLLLRDARDRLSGKVAADDLDRPRLIRRADRILGVPEAITSGLIAINRMRTAGTAVEPRGFTTTDHLPVILEMAMRSGSSSWRSTTRSSNESETTWLQ